jgi:hypothetical protein
MLKSKSPDNIRRYSTNWISAILAAVLFSGLLSGCASGAEEVTMPVKDFDFTGFNRIAVEGAFEFEITGSDTYKVSVASDDFPHMRVEKIGDRLIIGRQGIEWFAPFHSRPRAVVSLPGLKELNISGASHGKLENIQSDGDLAIVLSGASTIDAGNISVARLDLKVNGASTIKGDMKTAGDAKMDVSGASKVELTGASSAMDLKVSGASKTELGKFSIQNAQAEISGASNCYITLNGKLDANVSGASSLLWSGNPVMGDIQISGASNLRRK